MVELHRPRTSSQGIRRIRTSEITWRRVPAMRMPARPDESVGTFVELAHNDDGRTDAEEESAAPVEAPRAAESSGTDNLTAWLRRALAPAACSACFALVVLLAAALSPDGSLLRTSVFHVFTSWSWTFAIFLPAFLVHLLRALLVLALAALQTVAKRLRAKESAPHLLWRAVAVDVACALIAWLILGAVASAALAVRAPVPHGPEALKQFPGDFLFGAATSSYQVEGGLNNTQWSAFERDFVRGDGSPAILNDDRCGLAANSWELFDRDLECISRLGLRAYRLSIEWSRVEPREGEYDLVALAKYAAWMRELRAIGVEPVVTLHHFTEPLWLTHQGGLHAPEVAVPAFAAFVAVVAEALGDSVDVWVTINEPMVLSTLGWLVGEFPPGATGDLRGTYIAATTLFRMHRTAAEVLRATDNIAAEGGRGAPCVIGVAKSVALFAPASAWHPLQAFVAGVCEAFFSAWPLADLSRGRECPGCVLGRPGSGLDYVGVNHYFSQQVSGAFGFTMGWASGLPFSDMGWTMDGDSLQMAVTQVHAWLPMLPIIVTEHGCADGDVPDVRRVAFVEASLAGLSAAMRMRALPVQGYLHWSLIDNFEWAHGFSPRFGLFRVDYSTFERAWTDGARRYRDVVANASAAES